MSQRQPYITLDSCILDYMNETEQSQHKYFKLFHIAFRGMENLGLDFFYQVKSVKLPINANLTVDLPNDYLNWSKVGVLNDKGEIIPLYYNDKLSTYMDLQSDRLTKTQDDTIGNLGDLGTATWSNYWNGSSLGNIYGLPSGAPFVGSFKVDTANGVILLNETFSYDYLMIEYVASPIAGEDYYLPIQFREALIAWLSWKDSNAKTVRTHMTLGDKRDRKHEFYNERKNAIARWKQTRKAEIYQASQEQTRLAVKS
jgi:hypothetical protein